MLYILHGMSATPTGLEMPLAFTPGRLRANLGLENWTPAGFIEQGSMTDSLPTQIFIDPKNWLKSVDPSALWGRGQDPRSCTGLPNIYKFYEFFFLTHCF